MVVLVCIQCNTSRLYGRILEYSSVYIVAAWHCLASWLGNMTYRVRRLSVAPPWGSSIVQHIFGLVGFICTANLHSQRRAIATYSIAIYLLRVRLPFDQALTPHSSELCPRRPAALPTCLKAQQKACAMFKKE